MVQQTPKYSSRHDQPRLFGLRCDLGPRSVALNHPAQKVQTRAVVGPFNLLRLLERFSEASQDEGGFAVEHRTLTLASLSVQLLELSQETLRGKRLRPVIVDDATSRRLEG